MFYLILFSCSTIIWKYGLEILLKKNLKCAPVAQGIERSAPDAEAEGSSPSGRTICNPILSEAEASLGCFPYLFDL